MTWLALLLSGSIGCVTSPDQEVFDKLPFTEREGTHEAVLAAESVLGDDPSRLVIKWVMTEDFWAPSAGRRVHGASMEDDGRCLVWLGQPSLSIWRGPLAHELTHCAMGTAGIHAGDPRNDQHLDSAWWGPSPAMEGRAQAAIFMIGL